MPRNKNQDQQGQPGPKELSDTEVGEAVGGLSIEPVIVEHGKPTVKFREPLVGFQKPLVRFQEPLVGKKRGPF